MISPLEHLFILEKNNWAPEIEGDDTFSGISKMFPTGVALELAYPNIDVSINSPRACLPKHRCKYQ